MASTLNHRQALLILNGLQGVGPVMMRRLLDAFDGDPVAILSSEPKRLLEVKGVGAKVGSILSDWRVHFNLAKEVERMRSAGMRFVTQSDDVFPKMLKETYDPPIGLYWKGDYNLDRPCVAIVGTRRATLYGLSVAKRFAAELARMGFCIVSGMARGTDTAAHEGALEAGGRTVAVMGCGLDIVYPPENLDLYRRISEQGAVVSEFPLGRRADRQTFPMRNRVVAGMCEAVIVVESDASGGSMITARFAGEQGRQIMAVPGRIDQSSSAGCHQLIRDGATMVTSVDDILEDLRYERLAPEPSGELFTESSLAGLSDLEQEILACFQGGEVCFPDRLCHQLNRGIGEISATLMGMEIKRLVVKRADGGFEAR